MTSPPTGSGPEEPQESNILYFPGATANSAMRDAVEPHWRTVEEQRIDGILDHWKGKLRCIVGAVITKDGEIFALSSTDDVSTTQTLLGYAVDTVRDRALASIAQNYGAVIDDD